MKSAIASLPLLILVSAVGAAEPKPMPLAKALSSSGGPGLVRLSEGYRGVLRTVARTGVAAEIDNSHDRDVCEFTHFDAADRGVGNRSEPAFTIMVGAGRGYRLPATHIKDLPTIQRLKEFKQFADFEKVFGKVRGITDGWGAIGGGMHSTRGWTGFVLQSDGSVRVASVFLHTSDRDGVTTIEGGHFSEGIFKPTGKAPKIEKR